MRKWMEPSEWEKIVNWESALCTTSARFSVPPRVASRSRRAGLRGGWSLDLSSPDPVSGKYWDLSNPAEQAKVFQMIRRDKPMFIVGCPPCTIFSNLQNMNPNRGSDEWFQEWLRAVSHINFCLKVYQMQDAAGRFFVHEHPAKEWQMLHR